MYKPRKWAVLISVLLLVPMLAFAQKNSDAKAGERSNEKNGTAQSKKESKNDSSDSESKQGESESKPDAKDTSEGSEGSKAAGSDKSGGDKTDASNEEKGKYAVKLRDLEIRVNRLKEQVFRSKARLSLLAETVLDRKIAGSKVTLKFRNEMGGSFRLTKATFLLDGGPIYSKSDEGGNLAERKEIDLFDGPVMPGEHNLSVVLHYRGHGYGIFSYLKGYSFKVRSSRIFTVSEGKASNVEIIGFEKGGVTTPLEERPAVRYIEGFSEYNDEGESKSSSKGKTSQKGR